MTTDHVDDLEAAERDEEERVVESSFGVVVVARAREEESPAAQGDHSPGRRLLAKALIDKALEGEGHRER